MLIKNCSMREFFERCSSKKIACYGIGFEFEQMLKNYSQYPWEEKVGSLIDKNSTKWGNEYCIGKQSYKIIGLEQLLKKDTSDIILLISCSFYAEIIEQLNAIEQLQQVECYIYNFMFGLCEHNSIDVRRKKECLIPAKIHYCWFGGNELPDLYKRCIESWYKYCPDYEIIEWNESNCDITENIFVKQAYEKKKYGFVPDYFRLKIIYEYGGIYLDTDVELLKNIDDLRYNEAFCGLQIPGEAALGLGFGAVAGHPVVKKMLDRYKGMQFIKSDGTCDETISPVWQTMDLKELGMQYGNRMQEVGGMTIYPTEVLSPMNVFTGEIDITNYSYAIHHYDGSWVSGERLEKKKKRQENVRKIRQMMQR